MIEHAARRFGMMFWQACNSACTSEIPHADRLPIDYESILMGDPLQFVARSLTACKSKTATNWP